MNGILPVCERSLTSTLIDGKDSQIAAAPTSPAPTTHLVKLSLPNVLHLAISFPTGIVFSTGRLSVFLSLQENPRDVKSMMQKDHSCELSD